MADKPAYGSVWAKGYYDGLRAAENKKVERVLEKMNLGRYKSIMMGLSSIARKVYESVPISEEWTVQQIHNEINRKPGATQIDGKTLVGCLNHLVSSGVVREPKTAMFKRTPVADGKTSKKSEKNQINEDDKMSVEEKNNESKDLGPLDRICAITSKLRALADEIDDELLRVEKEMNDDAQKYKKLNQLQELLKSI